MRPLNSLMIGLILLASCSNSQTSLTRRQITGAIRTDINNLLPEGKVMADIMDGVKQNPRQAELTKKFQDGIKKNYEWFVEYVKTVREGEPMHYHPNLGMTESEFNELQNYMNNIEIISTGSEEVIIQKKGDFIQFIANGKLSVLETVKINLKNNIVEIGQYNLSFEDSLNITEDKNGLKSKWRGYAWRFEEPEDLGLDALKDLQNLKAKQYKFTIGRLDKNGKTYMSIKGREFENGTKTVEFEVPLIF